MNKNTKIFINMLIIITIIFCILDQCENSFSQHRILTEGNAKIGGELAVDTVSATSSISAPTFIFPASSTQLNVPETSSSQDGFVLTFDHLNNQIHLEAISLTATNIDSISDVTAQLKTNKDILSYNLASKVFEATPSILENVIEDVSATIKSDGYHILWDDSLQKWEATRPNLEFIKDVSATGQNNGDVLKWNTTTSQWEPGAESGGSGTGSAQVPIFIIAATDSINASSANVQVDGTSDEIEINWAVSQIASSTGGIVQLLEGTYSLAGPIYITTDNITIKGSGDNATILRRNFTADEIAVGNYGMIHIVGTAPSLLVDNIHISELAFDGQDQYSTAEDFGLLVSYANYLTLDNLLFYNHKQSAINLANSATATFRVINVTNSGNDNIVIGSNCNFLRFIDCHSHESDTGSGFYFSATSRFTQFTNCSAINNGVSGLEYNLQSSVITNFVVKEGVRGFDDQGTGTRNIFSNCIAQNCSSYGFDIQSASSTFSNCRSFSNAGGFYADNTADGTVFNNCEAELNSSYGFYIRTIEDINFINCIARSNTSNGFFADSAATNLNYFGCMSYRNIQYGMVFDTPDNIRIMNCIVSNNKNDAFYFNNGCQNVIVSNCYIENSADTNQYVYIIDDDGDAGEESILVLKNNTYVGTWNGLYLFGATQVTPPAQFNDGLIDTTGTSFTFASGMILASSADAVIGLATNDQSTITNIITVGSGATTDPIANAWTQWSQLKLKTNITAIDPDDATNMDNSFSEIPIISFDWKYPYPAPLMSSFEDIYDGTELVQSATDAFSIAYTIYESNKQNYENNPNKTEKLGFNVEDASFPNRLKTYGRNGNVVGVNSTELLNELVIHYLRFRKKVINYKQELDDYKSKYVAAKAKLDYISQEFDSHVISAKNQLQNILGRLTILEGYH